MHDNSTSLEGHTIVLLPGNTKIIKYPGVAKSNSFGNLIKELHSKCPSTKVLVAGALPGPDDEERITPEIKYQNGLTVKSCRHLRKQLKMDITFIGAYKIFLERFKHFDEQKNGMATNARIICPIDRYFEDMDAPVFNDAGVGKLYNYILETSPAASWTCMD